MRSQRFSLPVRQKAQTPQLLPGQTMNRSPVSSRTTISWPRTLGKTRSRWPCSHILASVRQTAQQRTSVKTKLSSEIFMSRSSAWISSLPSPVNTIFISYLLFRQNEFFDGDPFKSLILQGLCMLPDKHHPVHGKDAGLVHPGPEKGPVLIPDIVGAGF